MPGDRRQIVPGAGSATGDGRASYPAGVPRPWEAANAHPTRAGATGASGAPAPASGARDDTAPRAVVLAGRGTRGQLHVAKLNTPAAREDPFVALRFAYEYLVSVLRKTSARNGSAAAGWCWAVVHIIDALAAAVERGERPHRWFQAPENWRVNPRGWAPLEPVNATFAALMRRPGQEARR